MADTYSQIYIQIVFAVQNRQALIASSWEDELFKYIAGIIKNKGQKPLAINGDSDHIHLFIGMKPNCCWQEGFGAFSYSHSQIPAVIHYIDNQKEHHKKRSFKDEYLTFLKSFAVEFKNEFLFTWIDMD